MISSGGPRNSEPGTIPQLFFGAIEEHDRADALQVKVGGRYQPISSRELAERVRHLALGLEALGLAPGDRVGLLSENRPEWAIADYACATSGVVDVPLYPNLPADQACYILRDSGAVALFVSDAAQEEKLAPERAELPALRTVITFADRRGACADHTLHEVEEMGAARDDAEGALRYRRRAEAVRPEDLLTLIYTSGTTGAPKGVMLTHDNLSCNVRASAAVIPFRTGADVALSFLPLSHIFERMAGHYLMLHVGCSIAYAESIETVPANLLEVRPTLVLSVPRLYEKMYARVLENAAAGGVVKRAIFRWARAVGERWADVRLAGGTPGPLLALQYALGRRLVFSKLAQRTGGRLRYFVSGGAPLSPEINRFFYAAGLVILEGYGLTETSPVIAVNTPVHFRIGTVGRPIPGVEVCLAEDGEILTRGPHVMRGYFQRDDATREAIDADGWFHTGDVGALHDGFLSITDRKKDLIVTAGGKNIAPQPIEGLIKGSAYVAQAVLLGDRRPFPVVLVVPDWDRLEAYASAQRLSWSRRAELLEMPPIRELLEREVLARVAHLARFERPKRVALLEHDFTIERGELTPSMKVKRRVIEERYRAVIDALYAEEEGRAER